MVTRDGLRRRSPGMLSAVAAASAPAALRQSLVAAGPGRRPTGATLAQELEVQRLTLVGVLARIWFVAAAVDVAAVGARALLHGEPGRHRTAEARGDARHQRQACAAAAGPGSMPRGTRRDGDLRTAGAVTGSPSASTAGVMSLRLAGECGRTPVRRERTRPDGLDGMTVASPGQRRRRGDVVAAGLALETSP